MLLLIQFGLMNDHLFEEELFFWFTVGVFRDRLSIFVFFFFFWF